MIGQRRGKIVAVGGTFLGLVLTGAMLAIWLWTGSLAAMACTWMLAGSVPLSLIVALLFYCRELERREAAELEEGGGDRASATIFEGAEGSQLRSAASRLAWMERWAVPIFTFLWAAYHLAIAILMLRFLSGQQPRLLDNSMQGVLLVVMVAFVGFLFSRYATGMSARREWRLLRATGSYLLMSVLMVAGSAAALLAASQGYNRADLVVAYVVAVIQIILTAELVLNSILDFYRPRVPGQDQHPSFDSHLFAFVAEPERIGHSIASAVNYQFGFEVSKTWFYKLLERSFVPLLIFGAAILFAMSSVVIVQDGEQHVLFHWGKMQTEPLRGGLHLKWPWPIDTTQRFDVSRVYEVVVGIGKARPQEQRTDIIKGGVFEGRRLFLWTQEHGPHEELSFLVAPAPDWQEARETEGEKATIPVSMVKQVVSIQYTIEDVVKFGFGYTDARKVLECRAYQELVRHLASINLDEALGVTGTGESMAEMLKDRFQKSFGEDLGVRIRFIGIPVVHPPSEVAPDFEELLAAARRNDEKLYIAEATANRVLGLVAGTAVKGWRLALAARYVDELTALRDLRGKDGEFSERLRRSLHDARSDVRMLEKAVARERLLGQVLQGRSTDKQRLLEEHRRHVELLERIAAERYSFAFGAELEKADAVAQTLLEQASGKIAEEIAQARSDRWNTEMNERARAEKFQRELLAYNANPRIYKLDRWLSVLDRTLPEVTKYVLCVDRDKVEVWLDWQRERAVLEAATFAGDMPPGE